MGNWTIDKNSPIPLHTQLKNMVKTLIESGRYKPGDKFYSEGELAALCGVSRMTVRKAMDELSREGLILRIPGKGTFVGRRKLVEKLTELVGFTQDMESKGYVPSSRIVEKKVISPPEKIRSLLQLKKGEKVLFLKRIRYASGEAVALQVAYIPLKLFPGIEKLDLERESLYAVFKKFGRPPVWARQDMEPTLIKEEEHVRLLKASSGSVGMISERLTYDLEDNPIEFTTTLFRGENYRFTVNLINPEFASRA